MNEILAAFSLKKAEILASGLGAMIAFKFFREQSWAERIYTTVLSMPLALIGGGAISEQFELGPRTELFATVLVAALGIATLSALFKALPEWIDAARKKYLGS